MMHLDTTIMQHCATTTTGELMTQTTLAASDKHQETSSYLAVMG